MKFEPVSVTFQNPVTKQQEKRIISRLTLARFVDDPFQKRVIAFFSETIKPMLIWDGDEYDAAGQYSDSDLLARIEAIVSNNTTKVINDLFTNGIEPLSREEALKRHRNRKLETLLQ